MNKVSRHESLMLIHGFVFKIQRVKNYFAGPKSTGDVQIRGVNAKRNVSTFYLNFPQTNTGGSH